MVEHETELLNQLKILNKNLNRIANELERKN